MAECPVCLKPVDSTAIKACICRTHMACVVDRTRGFKHGVCPSCARPYEFEELGGDALVALTVASRDVDVETRLAAVRVVERVFGTAATLKGRNTVIKVGISLFALLVAAVAILLIVSVVVMFEVMLGSERPRVLVELVFSALVLAGAAVGLHRFLRGKVDHEDVERTVETCLGCDVV